MLGTLQNLYMNQKLLVSIVALILTNALAVSRVIKLALNYSNTLLLLFDCEAHTGNVFDALPDI